LTFKRLEGCNLTGISGVRGMVGARLEAAEASRLRAYRELADSHALALRAREAAVALLDLARDVRTTTTRIIAEQCAEVGRRLAAPQVVEDLLDLSVNTSFDPQQVADALRFRGPEVVSAVLARLNDAEERTARRAYFNVAVALGAHPELRAALVANLNLSLADHRWAVVRNAIALLTALGAPLPQDRLWDLAHASQRQVRLALAGVVARWRPGSAGLELLLALVEDDDAGVRFVATVALGNYAHPEARRALRRRARRESDPETKAVCEAGLARRVVEFAGV